MQRPLRIIGIAILAVAVLGGLLLAGLLLSLNHKPLPLGLFKDRAETEIAGYLNGIERFKGSAVNVGSVRLVGPALSPSFEATDVVVANADGTAAVELPAVRVKLDLDEMYAQRAFVPRTVTVEGLAVSLDIKCPLAGGAPAVEPAAPQADPVQAMLAEYISAIWSEPQLQHFDRFSLENARLDLTGSGGAASCGWRLADLSAQLTRRSDGFRISGSARPLLPGEAAPAAETIAWDADVTLPSANAAGTGEAAIAARMNVSGAADRLMRWSGQGLLDQASLGDVMLEAPVEAVASVEFPVGEWPSSVPFRVTLGEGRFRLPEEAAQAFRGVTVRGEAQLAPWRVNLRPLIVALPGEDRLGEFYFEGWVGEASGGGVEIEGDFSGLDFRPLAAASPDLAPLASLEGVFKGSAALQFGSDGQPQAGTVSLASQGPLMLHKPDYWDRRVPLDGASVRARLRDGIGDVAIEDVALDLGGGAAIAMSGAITRPAGAAFPHLALDVTAENLTVDHVLEKWPKPVAPMGRRWVFASIKAGEVPTFDGTFNADIDPASEDGLVNVAVDFAFPVRNATLEYWKAMPLATRTNAEMRVTEKRLDLTVHSGESGGITADTSTVVLTDMHLDDGPWLEADIALRGPVRRLMEALDREPLGLAKKAQLKPAEMEGTFKGSLWTRFNLAKELFVEDVELKAVGETKDAGMIWHLPKPEHLAGKRIDNGNLKIIATMNDLNLEGGASLEQVPLGLNVHVPFSNGSGYDARVRVRGSINDEERRALGFDQPFMQPPKVKGVIGVDMTATVGGVLGQRSGKPVSGTLVDISLDLSRTVLNAYPVNWRRDGERKFLNANMRARLLDGHLMQIDWLKISGAGVAVQASGVMPEGESKCPTVRLDRLQLAGGLSLSGNIAPSADGEWCEVRLDPGTVDLRPFFTEADEENSDEPHQQDPEGHACLPLPDLPFPLQLEARGLTIRLRDDAAMYDVDGDLRIRDKQVLDAEITGRTGPGAPFSISLSPHGHLQATAANFGHIVDLVGVDGEVKGGALSISGDLTSDLTAGVAEVHLTDFRLIDAPVTATIVKMASISAPLELLSSEEGLRMTELKVAVELRDRLLHLKNGYVYGGSLGLTLRGNVDCGHDRLNLEGSAVPGFVLSKILRSVPLFGRIFGDGVFAFRYTVTGPYTAPVPYVNPLSGITPGFLQELLSGEIRDDFPDD